MLYKGACKPLKDEVDQSQVKQTGGAVARVRYRTPRLYSGFSEFMTVFVIIHPSVPFRHPGPSYPMYLASFETTKQMTTANKHNDKLLPTLNRRNQ
ncbi:hypothetical protein VTJ04DRAFT_7779 [Mycothermus thermophilus]|uniref:uncharacterized protein n=1 Tax=Humicola insolens TaxID=85995 RepID=UPI0037437668